MECEIVDLFAGDLGHAAGPVAVAPSDEANVRIGGTHRRRKLDCLACGGLEVESALLVRSLVADLPIANAERGCTSMCQSLAIARIVAIGDPRGRFIGVGGANAVFRLRVLLPSVRLEVDAD